MSADAALKAGVPIFATSEAFAKSDGLIGVVMLVPFSASAFSLRCYRYGAQR
ncbi:unannotated protein [freshwater metagenome]|uniref:Unannotated protein n=1 Tax=freshwater metagenome TaxID=449393 RepID=A0A6J6EST1_9ZZZZ